MKAETEVNALEAVNVAINMEQSDHRLYLSAASRTVDRNGGEMFTRLANDELAHLFWLITVRQSLMQTGKFGEVEEIYHVVGRATTESLAYFPSNGRRGEVTAETGELEALELGIEDERRWPSTAEQR
jgi:rubrerythrin